MTLSHNGQGYSSLSEEEELRSAKKKFLNRRGSTPIMYGHEVHTKTTTETRLIISLEFIFWNTCWNKQTTTTTAGVVYRLWRGRRTSKLHRTDPPPPHSTQTLLIMLLTVDIITFFQTKHTRIYKKTKKNNKWLRDGMEYSLNHTGQLPEVDKQ